MKNDGKIADKNKQAHRFDTIFKIPLTFTIIILLLVPISSFFNIKPVIAGTLTSVHILPTNNFVNTVAAYEIFFKTATTGTIGTIEMAFPSSFDVSSAKYIEKCCIGSGTLSNPSGSTLVYTVKDPLTVAAGTFIRLEIGRIVNSETESKPTTEVSITTKSTGGNTIDGPTPSSSFVIKAIDAADISPFFMIRKTLRDDTVGHARGWDPNGITTDFTIIDHDAQTEEEAGDETFVSLMLRDSHSTKAVCMVNHTDDGTFLMSCNAPPADGAALHYEIHKLLPNVIKSSLSVSRDEGTISGESPFSPSMP